MSSSFHTGLGLGAWVIAVSQGGWFKLEGYILHIQCPQMIAPPWDSTPSQLPYLYLLGLQAKA